MGAVQQLDEEVRKIQFSGKSSYVLALPKKWIEEMGLRAGDQVTVARPSNASLVITTKGLGDKGGNRGEVTAELSQGDSKGSVVRKIVSLYVVGFNLIHLKGKEGGLTSVQRDMIKEAVRRHLVGTEVVADSTEGITLQVLLSYPQLNVENALRRMFLIAAAMHKDAVTALKLGKDSALGVIKTDDEVDRFSLYVIRQLKMAVENDRILKDVGLSTPRDCLGYRLIVKSVERVADHATRIAREALLIRAPLDETILAKILQMSDFALNLFNESSHAFFERNYNAADEIVDRATLFGQMEKELLAQVQEGKSIESYHTVRLIIEDIRRTSEYASDIAEVTLNTTIEQAIAF